jgi:hypothetical protein
MKEPLPITQHSEYMSVSEALEKIRMASEEGEQWKNEGSCCALAGLRAAGFQIKRYRVARGWVLAITEPDGAVKVTVG